MHSEAVYLEQNKIIIKESYMSVGITAKPYIRCTYIGIIFLLITLQEQIDTVTVEGVENVGEEDWIDIKREEDYIELVRRVKCEQEVSVLCCVFGGGDLCTGVCVCVRTRACMCVVLYTVFSYALFPYLHITSFQFLPVNQQMYLCDTFLLFAVCPNYYLFPFPHPSLPAAILLVAISVDVV
jgi:hypothetical protein